MSKEYLLQYFSVVFADWSVLFKIFFFIILIVMFAVAFYDRYVQRENQLLINYPLIGRMRYFFYLLRNPMRQYFGDETYYDSFEKIEWVNKVAKGKSPYISFSTSKPYGSENILFKHANFVKETYEVTENFCVTFGEDREVPFRAKSVIGRSAMSDGAISPEGTRAFANGAYIAKFPINTGEGGLTSNFLSTLRYSSCKKEFLQVKQGSIFAKSIYKIIKFFTNCEIAKRVYRKMSIHQKDRGTYIFDPTQLLFFRINWDCDISLFPKQVPKELADIVFQMGSGLYGVRDKDGNFDEERYKKIMSFCKMTEIKIAQGAKQTGGKLLASKVTEDIAYYRGVTPHKSLISPNRFPYASNVSQLFDFIEYLQNLSKKPVGFKIVISHKEGFLEYANELKKRVKEGRNIPDFITIDGGDGGSATAPLEMMSRVGLGIKASLLIAENTLNDYGIRHKIKIIASQKVLTPDDAIELFCYGADFINIARGFMISAGCIRARECSGANGRHCPVGLATMNEQKRSKFLVKQKSKNIARYHNSLIDGMRSLLAIMGKNSLKELSLNDIFSIKELKDK